MPFSVRVGFSLAFLSTLLAAQQPKVTEVRQYPATPVAQSPAPPGTIPTPMEMLPQVAPIFVEDGLTTSSLVIVNNSAVKAGATISVRSLSGAEVVSAHRNLKPHEQLEITLQSLLSGLPSAPSIGSVTVAQDPELIGLTIVSQMLLTSRRGALPSYIDEELAMPSIDGSTVLRGTADEANGAALVAVTSIVSWTQRVSVHCLFQDHESTPVAITLPPQSTVLVSNCSGQTVADVASYLSNIKQEHGIQGYELVTDGGIGTIAAFGLAPHSREQEQVLSGVPITDPSKIHASNSVFAGVPFGTQPALPDGVYTPRISFANFSSSPAHITVSAATTPPGDPSNTNATGASPAKRLLRQLTIAPRRTAEFMLQDSTSQSGLQQSLIVETDRKPGEVLSKVVSRSDGNIYEVELLGKDQWDENNGGSHPWSTEGDSVSHLLLFNYSEKPRIFGVGVSNGAIVWDKKFTLAPYETREISINELIRDKIPDDHNQILSTSLPKGVVNWMVPNSGQGTGRLMLTSHSHALARNFSCGQFIVVCGMTFSVFGNNMLPVNDTLALYSANPQFCDEFSPNQCYGGSYTGSGSASYSWSIGSSGIVRPNTGGDQYVSTPNLFGVGAGSGYANGTAEAGNCSSTGYGDPDVQVPTSTGIFSTDSNQARSGCPTGSAGWDRTSSVDVLDQNGQQIILSGQQMTETYTIDSNHNGLLMTSIQTGSATTNEAGLITDEWWVCSNQCPSSKTTSATQTPQDKFPTDGKTYTLTPNAVLYGCSAITVNGK